MTQMNTSIRRLLVGLATAASTFLTGPAPAQSLPEALVRAYQTNPQLNAARAGQRARDENVPQALAGYRPQLAASLSAGLQDVRSLLPNGNVDTGSLRPWQIGLTVTQTVFNGFKTANSVRSAEAQVRSGREALRNVGQGVLLDAVTAYANVLANQTLVESQRQNVSFLEETLNVARRRLAAGDVTPTDVAQAEARHNRGLADLKSAQVNLATSKAIFLQVIGIQPVRLAAPPLIDGLLPRNQDDALALGSKHHPAIIGAVFDIDVAQLNISIADASLLPSVTLQGSITRGRETDPTMDKKGLDQASIIGQVTAPIYDGGTAASQVRQAKELVSQARMVLDQVRAQTKAAIAAAWTALDGARVIVMAGESEVRAATLALEGVKKEAAGGQRTTLDVLNAQQDLIAARARLIQAERDRVIASYSLLSAVGRLDVATLKLKTQDYLPEVHYHQVRDAWHGVRTPSGQ